MLIAEEESLRSLVSLRRILSEERVDRVARVRQAIMYRAYEETEASLLHIGEVLNRHHTTVLSGIDRHAMRIGRPPVMSRNRIAPLPDFLPRSMIEGLRKAADTMNGKTTKLSRDRFHITLGALRAAFKGRNLAGINAEDLFNDIDLILNSYRDLVVAARITAADAKLTVKPDSALGRALTILKTVGE